MMTKTDIQNTAEYQWRGRLWKGYLILLVIITVISAFMILPRTADIGAGFLVMEAIVGIYLVIFLPLGLHSMLQQRRMVDRADSYVRCIGTLSNPAESRFYKRSIYYQITFEPEEGTQLTRKTQPLFSLAAWEDFNAMDYNGREAEIFYDKEKDCVIVIDMVAEETEDDQW